MSRILGIDAGFACLGLVVMAGEQVLHAEAVRTEPAQRKKALRVADDDAERCQFLARELARVIDTWKPAGAVVELPSGGAQGARSHRTMGMATAVVASVLEITGIAAEWVTPLGVKKAAAGRKDASKAEVATAVREWLDWSGVALPQAKIEREAIYDAAGALLAARQGTLFRVLAGAGR